MPASRDPESLPSSVDLEMFCQSLALQSLQVVSTLESHAEVFLEALQRRYCPDGAMLGLWRWTQPKETKELLLLPPQPITSPMRANFDTERLDDMKTQLQLIYAAVDDLQSKAEQIESKLDSLQEQLRRLPTCHCRPQDTRTHVATTSTTTSSNAQNVRAPKETTIFEFKRLEVPMVLHRPRTFHNDSDAILRGIQAMDRSFPHTDSKPEQRIPLHDASLTSGVPNTMHEILASAQDLGGQGQLEQQDDTNPDQDPVMDIAHIYRLLARDDGL